MNKDRWQQIEKIFYAAMELPREERDDFISQACAGDEELLREVQALLAANHEAESFLDAPVQMAPHSGTFSPTLVMPHPTANAGAMVESGVRIGAYRLIREIGRGGMGAVWLAERDDGHFYQQVAIKLLHADSENEEVIRRFRHERQILASLDHPNIARLLDGGTTEDGRPYFVMEYIEGLPIDQYCRQQQLSVDDRLKLFRQVCAALHYAHQNLVIHRDLKPSNIAVTEDGTPKLLDFGIAKLVHPDLSRSYETLDGMTPMTPAYASPEQVRGEKLTTASDVYSLGVVLYELLTGRSPYRLKAQAFGELMRAIIEQEPERPSTAITRADGAPPTNPITIEPTDKLRRRLSGDIDSIVLMSLRKEPPSRYGSVEQFSEDLRLYLEGLPTQARRGTFGYRALKYIRRNKVPVSAAALILLSLLGGIGATMRQARIAKAAQFQAETEKSEAQSQRNRAEAALTTAEERRQQSEAARTEANQQRVEAEVQRNDADRQRDVANQQRLFAEQQGLSNRRLLYASQLRLAQNAWDNTNVERVQELLTAHLPQLGQPDMRGFEWYYLWKLSHAEIVTMPHDDAVDSVAFTPDGKNLITIAAPPGDTSKVLRIWDTNTWQVKYRLTGDFPTDIGNGVVISKSSELFATGGFSMGLNLWNVVTGKRIKKISESIFFTSLTLSPDGTRLAGGLGDGSVIVYDVQTGQEISRLKGFKNPILFLVFSPDGQKLAVQARPPEPLKFYDTTSGKKLWELQSGQQGYYAPIFSPDGRYLVCAIQVSSRVVIIEPYTGKEIKQIETQSLVSRFTFSTDGKRLAFGQRNQQVTLYDTETWQMLTTFPAHSFWISSLHFSPDRQKLATASTDGTVKLWDISPGQLSDTYQLPKRSYVEEMEFSSDASRLSIMDADLSVHVFDTTTKQKLFTAEAFYPHNRSDVRDKHKHPFAQTRDGSRIAISRDQGIKIIDAATGRELLTINTPGLLSYAISFSSDGRMIAANLCKCVIDKATGYPPAGDLNYLGVWDTATGHQILKIDRSDRADLVMSRTVFLNDGQTLITGGDTGNLVWWDLATRKQKKVLNTGVDGNSLLLSPDGRLLALTDNNASIHLFDAMTGEKLTALKGHNYIVTRMAFSPDSKRLLSGGMDRTVRLWDLITAQELMVFEKTSEHGCVAFSADGKRIAISYDDRGVVKELIAADPKRVQVAGR